MASPVRSSLLYLRLRTLGRITDEPAAHQGAFPVDDEDFIPLAVPQHAHAMPAFLRVQKAHAAAYLICVEQLHPYLFARDRPTLYTRFTLARVPPRSQSS